MFLSDSRQKNIFSYQQLSLLILDKSDILVLAMTISSVNLFAIVADLLFPVKNGLAQLDWDEPSETVFIHAYDLLPRRGI